MSEIKEALMTYLLGANQVWHHTDDEVVLDLINVIQSGHCIFRDAPDLFIKKGERGFIFEHFRIDCYFNKRKGSSFIIEKSRVERRVDNIELVGGKLDYSDEIHGRSSYHYLIENARQQFKKHYKQIDNYYSNLIKDGVITEDTNTKVVFVIEDVSPLSPAVFLDDYLQPINLMLSTEFLDLLKESPRVGFVLTLSTNGDERIVGLIDCKKLTEYQNAVIDYASLEFAEFHPRVHGYCFEITQHPKETNS